MEGLPGLSGGDKDGVDNSNPKASAGGNLADQVVNSALRYRSQAPFVDSLLGEIGMSAENVHKIDGLQNLSKIVYSEAENLDETSGNNKTTVSKKKTSKKKR